MGSPCTTRKTRHHQVHSDFFRAVSPMILRSHRMPRSCSLQLSYFSSFRFLPPRWSKQTCRWKTCRKIARCQLLSACASHSRCSLDTLCFASWMPTTTRCWQPLSKMYDRDSSSTLNKEESKCLLEDMNLAMDPNAVDRLFNETDIDRSGSISFDEFSQCLYTWMTTSVFQESMARSNTIVPSYDIEGEEDEEMDEDLANLDPSEQKKRILLKASRLMLAGTALVLAFSDPLVDNLTEIGNRLSIPPFYVAFIIAPFASNASELISAKNYAAKKTQKSMTTSLGTLVGAACMNNTFGMGVVFGLMYVQGLAWKFTAETIAIVLSQWIIGALAIVKSVHTPMIAIVILAMYPGCLVLVSVLYKIGLD